MNKTYIYLLVTIAVFLIVVKGVSNLPLNGSSESDNDSNSKNSVAHGADGQQSYKFGAPYSASIQNQSTAKAQSDLRDKIKSDISYTN